LLEYFQNPVGDKPKNCLNIAFKRFNIISAPRVFVKKGIGRMEFFEILNKRKIE
jgi:hypothetical protein